MSASIGKVIGELEFRDNFTARLSNSLRGLEKAGHAWARVGGQVRAAGANLLPISVAIVAAGAAVSKASISFESAFAGVKKTVEGTAEELQDLRDGFRNMAQQIPATVEELATIGEAAGQLGVEKENIIDFTRVMADLGVTTNLSSDEAATSLARLANITQLPETEFDKLGSTIVHLGNNLATTEAEIVRFSLRIAGAGKEAGLTDAEILSLGGALSSVGLRAEAAGTAISKALIRMSEATAKGGMELQKFAEVAGLSANEFAAAFKDNAANALTLFIEGLKNAHRTGRTTFGVLEDLELTEIRMRDTLVRTANAQENLNLALEVGREGWFGINRLTEEAEKRYTTAASKIQVVKNKINDLMITIGDQLVPITLELLSSFERLIPKLEFLTFTFSELDSGTQKAIVVFFALVAAAGPVLFIAGQMVIAITALTTAIGGLATSFPVVTSLLLGPWGIAIGLATAGLISLADNFISAATISRQNMLRMVKDAKDLQTQYEKTKRALESFDKTIKEIRIKELAERLGEQQKMLNIWKNNIIELSEQWVLLRRELENKKIWGDTVVGGVAAAAKQLDIYKGKIVSARARIRELKSAMLATMRQLEQLNESWAKGTDIIEDKVIRTLAETLKLIEDLTAENARLAGSLQAWKDLVEDWEPVLREAKDGIKGFTTELLTLGDSEVLVEIETHTAGVARMLKEVGESASEAFDEFVNGGDAANGRVETLSLTIEQRLLKSLDSVAKMAQPMAQAFGHAFEEMSKGVGDVINGLVQAVNLIVKFGKEAKEAGGSTGPIGDAVGGAGIGAAIGGIGGQFFGGAGGNFAAEGGALGGLIGGIVFGAISGGIGAPLGAVIGSVIGTIVGGLIQKGLDDGIAQLKGGLKGDVSTMIFENQGGLGAVAEGLAQGVLDGAQRILTILGGDFTGLRDNIDFHIRDGIIEVTVGLITKKFTDAQAAVEFGMIQALANMNTTGLGANVKAVLSKGAADTIGELQQALDIADRLDLGSLSELGKALEQIRRKYNQLTEIAIKHGISLDQIEQARLDEIAAIERQIQQASDQIQSGLLESLIEITGSEEAVIKLLEIQNRMKVAFWEAELKRLEMLGIISSDELLFMQRLVDEAKNLLGLGSLAPISEDPRNPGPGGTPAKPLLPTFAELTELSGELQEALEQLEPGYNTQINSLLDLRQEIEDFNKAAEKMAGVVAISTDAVDAAIEKLSNEIEMSLLDNILRYIDDEKLRLRFVELKNILEIANMRAQLIMLEALGVLTQAQIDLIRGAIDEIEDIFKKGIPKEPIAPRGGGSGGGDSRAEAAERERLSTLDNLIDLLRALSFGPDILGIGPDFADAINKFRDLVAGGKGGSALVEAGQRAFEALKLFTNSSGPLFERIRKEMQLAIASAASGLGTHDPLVQQILAEAGFDKAAAGVQHALEAGQRNAGVLAQIGTTDAVNNSALQAKMLANSGLEATMGLAGAVVESNDAQEEQFLRENAERREQTRILADIAVLLSRRKIA